MGVEVRDEVLQQLLEDEGRGRSCPVCAAGLGGEQSTGKSGRAVALRGEDAEAGSRLLSSPSQEPLCPQALTRSSFTAEPVHSPCLAS